MINIMDDNNSLEFLKNVLSFYSDPNNYKPTFNGKSRIEVDEYGHQARFALEKINELKTLSDKTEKDYMKIITTIQDDDDIKRSTIERWKNLNLLNDDINNIIEK